MAGEIKRIIDCILEQRGRNDAIRLNTTRAKLIFRGINPDRFLASSLNDPLVEAKLRQIASEMGIKL